MGGFKTIIEKSLKTFTLSFTAIWLLSSPIDAANIHAIIVCDTLAENIGDSVEEDLKIVHRELVKISNNTNLALREKQFLGENVNEEILIYLENSTFQSDDVVVFFFSGHGYRTDTKYENRWPNLFFTPTKIGVDFDLIVKIMEEKKPRLIISIADCCNNIIPDESAPTTISKREFYLGVSMNFVKRNYEELFLNQSGSIIMSSSRPGELSWGTRYGGLFTLTFFKSLNKELLSSQSPDWTVLLDRASIQIAKKQSLNQTPQYEVNLKRIAEH